MVSTIPLVTNTSPKDIVDALNKLIVELNAIIEGLVNNESIFNLRVLTSGASTTLVPGIDYILVVNKASGSATTVNLPSTPTKGQTFVIVDGKGDAMTNNITIQPAAGLISGFNNFVMNIGYESATVTYNGSSWSVL